MTPRRCAGCFTIIEPRSNRLYHNDACKQRAYRQRSRRNGKGGESVTAKGPVPCLIRGTNGMLIAEVARLGYLGGPEDMVLDVTPGREKWWTRHKPTNLVSREGVDFTHLPDADDSIPVVCYDPPYITTGNRDTSTIGDFYDRYGLGDIKGWQAGRELYDAGLAECARVLRPRGLSPGEVHGLRGEWRQALELSPRCRHRRSPGVGVG